MAAKFKYKAQVSPEGNLDKIFGSRGFYQDLKLFAGKSIWIEISDYRKSRSTKQNSYYHVVVVPMVLEGLVDAGYERYKLSSEVVHELLKEKFLKQEIASEITGEVLTVTRSTTDLSTVEFAEFIASVQQWASEYLNIVIASPGDQAEMNF
jgi:hypothetical protein